MDNKETAPEPAQSKETEWVKGRVRRRKEIVDAIVQNHDVLEPLMKQVLYENKDGIVFANDAVMKRIIMLQENKTVLIRKLMDFDRTPLRFQCPE